MADNGDTDGADNGDTDGDVSLVGRYIPSGFSLEGVDLRDGTTIPVANGESEVVPGLGTVKCVSAEGCLGTVVDGELRIMGNLQIVIVDPALDDAEVALLAEVFPVMLPTTPPVTPPVTSTLASLDAEAVAGAIGPDDTRGEAPTQPFTVLRGEVTKSDDAEEDFGATEATLPDLGEGWSGAEYMRTDMEDDPETEDMVEDTITTTVVSYTNAEAPGDMAYTEYYDGMANRDGVTGAADSDGVLTLGMGGDTGSHELFSIAFGITAPHQTIPIADDAETMDVNEGEFEGMFTGIPGTFTCTGEACSVESDDMGNLSMLNGSWTFTPMELDEGEHMVAGVDPDAEYLDFGFWVTTTTTEDGVSYEVGTFANGAEPHVQLAIVKGSATYAGPATGLYMTKTFNPNTGTPNPEAAGQFTADAMLFATFDQTDEVSIPRQPHSISGTVTNFLDSNGDPIMIGGEEAGWVVELMKATIENNAYESMTSGGEGTDKGAYKGSFYGDDMPVATVTPVPTATAGTFNAHFSNGHAAGAFGAPIDTEDE